MHEILFVPILLALSVFGWYNGLAESGHYSALLDKCSYTLTVIFNRYLTLTTLTKEYEYRISGVQYHYQNATKFYYKCITN